MTSMPTRQFRIPLCGQDDLIGGWVTHHAGGSWFPGRGKAIGLLDNKGIAAGVIYEGYTKDRNIYMHVACRPGMTGRWLTRKYLWMCFHYPFVQLNCVRTTASVDSTNEECLRFVKHIGFVFEARLEKASKDGDLLIFALWKDSTFVKSLLEYGEKHYAADTRRETSTA